MEANEPYPGMKLSEMEKIVLTLPIFIDILQIWDVNGWSNLYVDRIMSK